VSLTTTPMQLSDLTEKKWDDQLFSLTRKAPGIAPMLGWKLAYHTHRADKSPAGFPDRVLVRERVIFAELKRQPPVSKRDPTRELMSGVYKITSYQVEWLDALAAAGQEVYVWVPSDFDEVGQILGTRWFNKGGGFLLAPGRAQFYPGCAWVAGQGRRDGRQV
jgi:hypothetical protein